MSDYQTDEEFVLVSIEGDIGAGKSTLMNFIRMVLVLLGYEVVIAREPVDMWISSPVPDINGEIHPEAERKNMLGTQYEDAHTRSLIQADFYTTRVKVQREAINNACEIYKRTGKKPIILTERSRISDFFVFGAIGRLSGAINDEGWIVYNHVIEVNPMITPDLIVYLRTEFETCRDRSFLRARNGEVKVDKDGNKKHKIDRQYHKTVSDRHDAVFGSKGTHPADFQFDGTASITDMDDDAKKQHYIDVFRAILEAFGETPEVIETFKNTKIADLQEGLAAIVS
jgi:deoxyadenosine/deoxycytidine kinase